jgi:hypothetical protein
MSQIPGIAFAQICVTSGLQPFTPNRLTVDCASRRNFALWRKNVTYQGLAGAVSMSFVRGKYGEFPAGNLFLFPWHCPTEAWFNPSRMSAATCC